MSEHTDWRASILAALRDEDRWQDTLETLLTIPPDQRAERIDSTLSGALVLLLGDPSRTRQRRAADALRGLVDGAPELARALGAALGALEPRLRWGAAYTMGHAIRPPAANLWPAVRETLALEDGDQRWAAAELTCELARHHPSVRDDVIATVSSSAPTMRRMLLYCLRDLADPALLAIATGRLADDDAGVRLAALAASARAERTDADTTALADRVAHLVDGDPDAGVRRAAAATLGKLGAATAIVQETLRHAVASRDPSLARAAAAALARLGAESQRN